MHVFLTFCVIAVHGADWQSFPWFEAPATARIEQAVAELTNAGLLMPMELLPVANLGFVRHFMLPPRLNGLVLDGDAEDVAGWADGFGSSGAGIWYCRP